MRGNKAFRELVKVQGRFCYVHLLIRMLLMLYRGRFCISKCISKGIYRKSVTVPRKWENVGHMRNKFFLYIPRIAENKLLNKNSIEHSLAKISESYCTRILTLVK